MEERLYDLILKNKTISDDIKDDLDGLTVIESNNVGRYYFQESDQEYWDMKHFPNIAPPFEKFWLDFSAPEYIYSKERGRTEWKKITHWGFSCFGLPLLTTDQREIFLHDRNWEKSRNYFEPHLAQSRWCMDMFMYWREKDGSIPDGPVWAWRLLIDDQGQIVRDSKNNTIVATGALSKSLEYTIERYMQQMQMPAHQAMLAVYGIIQPYWHTALLAISFMHCKNVDLKDVVPPMKHIHNKAQKRRGEQQYQPVPYKVLDIAPMRQILKDKGQSEIVGTQKSLHICRGNFAHYKDGRGLFGRPDAGTYWRPMHARGNKAKGVTTRDYRIEL